MSLPPECVILAIEVFIEIYVENALTFIPGVAFQGVSFLPKDGYSVTYFHV